VGDRQTDRQTEPNPSPKSKRPEPLRYSSQRIHPSSLFYSPTNPPRTRRGHRHDHRTPPSPSTPFDSFGALHACLPASAHPSHSHLQITSGTPSATPGARSICRLNCPSTNQRHLFACLLALLFVLRSMYVLFAPTHLPLRVFPAPACMHAMPDASPAACSASASPSSLFDPLQHQRTSCTTLLPRRRPPRPRSTPLRGPKTP